MIETFGEIEYLPKSPVIFHLTDLHMPWDAIKADPNTRILMSITKEKDDPEHRGMIARQLSITEWRISLPILRSYPGYCPYHVLYAAYLSSDLITTQMIADADRVIRQAKAEKTMDKRMNDVRRVIDRCRKKFAIFGLNFLSIYSAGFTVAAAEENQRSVWTDLSYIRRMKRLGKASESTLVAI